MTDSSLVVANIPFLLMERTMALRWWWMDVVVVNDCFLVPAFGEGAIHGQGYLSCTIIYINISNNKMRIRWLLVSDIKSLWTVGLNRTEPNRTDWTRYKIGNIWFPSNSIVKDNPTTTYVTFYSTL